MVSMDDDDFTWLVACAQEVDRWLVKGYAALHNEIKVHILRPDGSELNNGHLDLLMIATDGTTGLLFDYKFGWIPVPPAEVNLQGMGYALGCFNKFPALKRIGVVFIQPKLAKNTYCFYSRPQLHEMYSTIRDVIDAAQAFTDPLVLGNNPESLHPNPYCDFCARAGNCPALIAAARLAVTKFEAPEMPVGFDLARLQTPKEIASAIWWIDRLKHLIEESTRDEGGLKGLRQRALAMAQDAGGTLRVEVAEGQEVVLQAGARKAPRSAEHPALIAEALAEVLQPHQVLGCCDIALTKLEEVFADTLVAKHEVEAEKLLLDEEARAAAVEADDPKEAKCIRKEAKSLAREIRTTKKAAKEALDSILTNEGLVSRAEGLVHYLKVRLEKNSNALPQPTTATTP
jgi:hypothetical protein